jgi:hypothetical protein
LAHDLHKIVSKLKGSRRNLARKCIEMIGMERIWRIAFLMDFEDQMLTWCCLLRFSQSIFSTRPLPLRPADTSSRYDTIAIIEALCSPRRISADSYRLRTLSLLLDPSSWMSSAPAASQSPPSSHTHKPSSSALAARPSSANRLVERLVSQRAAPSEESRPCSPCLLFFSHLGFGYAFNAS